MIRERLVNDTAEIFSLFKILSINTNSLSQYTSSRSCSKPAHEHRKKFTCKNSIFSPRIFKLCMPNNICRGKSGQSINISLMTVSKYWNANGYWHTNRSYYLSHAKVIWFCINIGIPSALIFIFSVFLYFFTSIYKCHE